MQDLETKYLEAKAFYSSGNFKQAIANFLELIKVRNFEKDYWFGLASSFQQDKNFEKAISIWDMTIVLDQNNPYCYFHKAESLLSLGDKEKALTALTKAEEEADTKLLEKINLLKTLNF